MLILIKDNPDWVKKDDL